MARQLIPLMDRIQARLETAPTGCWLWTGALTHDGYGYTGRGGRKAKKIYVHRAMFEAHNGPVPDGLCLDHLCRVRNCANPDHLEPVTGRENQRRRKEANTHCRRGHTLTPDNLYDYPHRGLRLCKACVRFRYQQKRAA